MRVFVKSFKKTLRGAAVYPPLCLLLPKEARYFFFCGNTVDFSQRYMKS